ncbi:MAG: DNA-binding protein [Spirochaetae bacterium HGW-Spirochaetae-1]|jgi:heterodisulfide reductase subunit C|nr:MAG: DNA-binding protein [Spirochaetae bacterium HGW-Spirochaetae-1]
MDDMVKKVDAALVKSMLRQKEYMRDFLSVCASCGACSGSCFHFRNHGDPRSTPSFKAMRSLGLMFKKGRRLTMDDLEEMKDLIWGKCVLCRRCYCPMGIDVSSMIAWARSICRVHGVSEDYEKGPKGI